MKLVRTYTPMGTFGKLYDVDNKFICYTVEQNWANNTPNKSCVPEGDYELIPFYSSRYGQTVALKNMNLNVSDVPSHNALRYACLFHSANYAKQLEGCIAAGSNLGVVSNEWAVLNSGNTTNMLLKTYFNKDKKLTITH